mmetsp:Transcript_43588/g.80646  ORF Transcript_43588/g.80646 Transcript_43588/m.80646 type:complete len:209 (-) Transcript_43588:306-932(-)
MFSWMEAISEDKSNPATTASPLVGLNRPHSMEIVVVFPAPLWPNSPKHSLWFTAKLKPSTATLSDPLLPAPGNTLRNPSTRTAWSSPPPSTRSRSCFTSAGSLLLCGGAAAAAAAPKAFFSPPPSCLLAFLINFPRFFPSLRSWYHSLKSSTKNRNGRALSASTMSKYHVKPTMTTVSTHMYSMLRNSPPRPYVTRVGQVTPLSKAAP